MASDKPIKEQVSSSERTMCEATAQMLDKARRDGVLIDLDRGYEMKPCPIGVESACCKHCYMGPCRLNPRDPYKKVGVCGATIDTIMARNFARNVATGSASHNDHGMHILKLFRDIVEGKTKEFTIKDTIKLERVAKSIGIEVEGKEVYAWPRSSATNWTKPFPTWKGRCPLPGGFPKRPWNYGAKTASFPGAPCGK